MGLGNCIKICVLESYILSVKFCGLNLDIVNGDSYEKIKFYNDSEK